MNCQLILFELLRSFRSYIKHCAKTYFMLLYWVRLFPVVFELKANNGTPWVIIFVFCQTGPIDEIEKINPDTALPLYRRKGQFESSGILDLFQQTFSSMFQKIKRYFPTPDSIFCYLMPGSDIYLLCSNYTYQICYKEIE